MPIISISVDIRNNESEKSILKERVGFINQNQVKLAEQIKSAKFRTEQLAIDVDQYRTNINEEKLLEEELFGVAPIATINLPSEVSNSRDKYLNGKARMMETTINLTYNGKVLPIEVLLFLPNEENRSANLPALSGGISIS